MKPPGQLLRRPTPPAAPAASSPLPPSPSPSPALPLPSALVPPKKRRVLQTPRKAATPIPPPPPLPAVASSAAADTLVAPAPTSSPQADAAVSPPAGDQKPDTPPPPTAGKPSTPPPAAAEKPSSPPPPVAEKPSSPPPPAVEKPSTPPTPAAEKPSSPPPPAVDEKPSTPPPTDAAAKPAATRKARKITRRVTVRKVVPKGTLATRKAAAGAVSGAAGALQLGEGCTTNELPSDQNADLIDLVDMEQNLGETTVEKPATDCNAVASCEALLGQVTAAGGTIAGKTEDCDAPELEMEKLLSKGEERDEVGMSEWQRRKMMEVFVGGLNRDAKEGDVRAVLAKAGEITEVRIIMDARTKKNKGYCFVRYRKAAQARKAIAEFGNVKICGKICRVAALDGNDKIFLGNIDKKWKKEDILKLLQKIGVENIDGVTLMADCNNPGFNHGFAFLELETNRDAQIAYRKLSRKDVFGKGLNVRVAWAEPLYDPDDKEMQKVKTVFVEGIPNSWDQAKMTEIFKKYGQIERVILPRDMQSVKRNDIAFIHYTTHEAAILCLESFVREELTENGSKVNIKVELAKPVQKGKQNKDDHKSFSSEKDKTKIAQSERKVGPSSGHIMPSSSRVVRTTGYKESSTTHDLLHVLREMAPWRHAHIASAPDPIQDTCIIYSGEKRLFFNTGR